MSTKHGVGRGVMIHGDSVMTYDPDLFLQTHDAPCFPVISIRNIVNPKSL